MALLFHIFQNVIILYSLSYKKFIKSTILTGVSSGNKSITVREIYFKEIGNHKFIKFINNKYVKIKLNFIDQN